MIITYYYGSQQSFLTTVLNFNTCIILVQPEVSPNACVAFLNIKLNEHL